MTRQHNLQIHCPNCGVLITHETSFGRWIRNNKQLDSAKGYCVIDQDYLIHKFKTEYGRDFQLLMMVEIKTHGADLTMAQRDTLLTFDQIMRNRRRTPTKALRRQIDNNVNRKIKSWVTGKEVVLKAFGAHSLIFSGLGPDDSEWIKWDNKLIDIYILTNLLRFDLDPDELVPIDFRNHHKLSKKSQLKQATMFSSIDEQKSCARK